MQKDSETQKNKWLILIIGIAKLAIAFFAGTQL